MDARHELLRLRTELLNDGRKRQRRVFTVNHCQALGNIVETGLGKNSAGARFGEILGILGIAEKRHVAGFSFMNGAEAGEHQFCFADVNGSCRKFGEFLKGNFHNGCLTSSCENENPCFEVVSKQGCENENLTAYFLPAFLDSSFFGSSFLESSFFPESAGAFLFNSPVTSPVKSSMAPSLA